VLLDNELFQHMYSFDKFMYTFDIYPTPNFCPFLYYTLIQVHMLFHLIIHLVHAYNLLDVLSINWEKHMGLRI